MDGELAYIAHVCRSWNCYGSNTISTIRTVVSYNVLLISSRLPFQASIFVLFLITFPNSSVT